MGLWDCETAHSLHLCHCSGSKFPIACPKTGRLTVLGIPLPLLARGETTVPPLCPPTVPRDGHSLANGYRTVPAVVLTSFLFYPSRNHGLTVLATKPVRCHQQKKLSRGGSLHIHDRFRCTFATDTEHCSEYGCVCVCVPVQRRVGCWILDPVT